MSKKSDAAPTGSRWLSILVGGLSFGLLACAYAPLSWTELVFFASAPWFAYAAAHPERGYWWGNAAAMMAWGGTLLCWLSSLAGAPVAGYIGWVAVSLIFWVFSLPFAWSFKRLVVRTRWPLALLVPLTMTAFDALRRFGTAGIAWHDPGYALHAWTEWIQVADFGRVYPLSFVLWAINGCIADLLLMGFRAQRKPNLATFGASVLCCGLGVGAILLYGHSRIDSIEAQLTDGPKICGVQPSISQSERLEPGISPAERRYQKCLALMKEAAAVEKDVDLFVWPETSFFRVDDSRKNPDRRRMYAPLSTMLNTRRRQTRMSVSEEFRAACQGYAAMPKFLIGMVTYDDLPEGFVDIRGEGLRERNSAILLDFTPDGTNGAQLLRATARADKQKLVPFGEYIPFSGLSFKRQEFVDWVENTAGYLPAMTPGAETALWTTELGGKEYEFSVNICYEVVFPEVFAEGRRRGAEFIINTSNDAWYDESAERDLCNAQIRFRAVENRLGILRLSNTGISSFVDPLGRPMLGMLEKNQKGRLSARIPLGAAYPWAVEGGIWVERILIALLFLALILGRGNKGK
ncbi:MAG: apolipoprotein N-acyltransferase [Planctomycetota bacterium]